MLLKAFHAAYIHNKIETMFSMSAAKGINDKFRQIQTALPRTLSSTYAGGPLQQQGGRQS